MKVWLVEEGHKADGTHVLAVLDYEPSQEEAEALAARRSSYKADERAEWCKVYVSLHPVEEREP